MYIPIKRETRRNRSMTPCMRDNDESILSRLSERKPCLAIPEKDQNSKRPEALAAACIVCTNNRGNAGNALLAVTQTAAPTLEASPTCIVDPG